eukprot:m.257878 g.257878  ORF g.257878 m.257878 type:complete len:917 (-) comp35811_c0_seq1:172-2922(-)
MATVPPSLSINRDDRESFKHVDAHESELQPLINPENGDEPGPSTSFWGRCFGKKPKDKSKKEGLGTFEGVFVPCVLSIFSVVLFLRMGFIVGQAGLYVTLGMLFTSYGVVLFTILSLSAICTNGVVRGGGAYFMISRTLGPEFGGAIGIVFYFANVFSSALYVIGFVESFTHTVNTHSKILPVTEWYLYAYNTAISVFCLTICLIGAKAFAKASLVIWVVVMFSVFMVMINFAYAKSKDISCPHDNTLNQTGIPGMTGGSSCAEGAKLEFTQFSTETMQDNLIPSWYLDYTTGKLQSFTTVFAVLFNGCTGIMAGANISGDLADASYSIPYGTMAASGFTFAVYVVLFTLTAGSCSSALLINDYSYMQDINNFPYIVIAGIFAATLSAALSTLIGASRILQAISRDNLLGDWFLFFSKETKEPLRAVFMSWILVQLAMLIGNINILAPIVSMLYLISYAITNFACFALAVTGAPNFRPTFKYFSWHTGLCGFIGCISIMFWVNAAYAAATVIVVILIWLVIHIRHVPVDWGDVSHALMYHQVRKYLLRISKTVNKPGTELKYWRPQFLFLVHNPKRCFETVRFLNDLKKGGLLIIGKVMVSPNSTTSDLKACQGEFDKSVSTWVDFVRVCNFKAFVDQAIADSVRAGLRQFLYTSGLGNMRPNLIMFGFHETGPGIDSIDELARYRLTLERSFFRKSVDVREFDRMVAAFDDISTEAPPMKPSEYVGMLHDAIALGKNVGIMRNIHKTPDRLTDAKLNSGEQHFIDVWLYSLDSPQTYELLLQMGTILRTSKRFKKNTKLRVLTISSSQSKEQDLKELKNTLASLRIQGDIRAIVSPFAQRVKDHAMNLELYKELNSLMKGMDNCSTIFTNLPIPPDEVERSDEYIANLDAFSAGLPPILLLYGQESVTTTVDNAI